jgi:hypothetical protein
LRTALALISRSGTANPTAAHQRTRAQGPLDVLLGAALPDQARPVDPLFELGA